MFKLMLINIEKVRFKNEIFNIRDIRYNIRDIRIINLDGKIRQEVFRRKTNDMKRKWLTSVIIFPLVLLRSRWLAFFSSCCITRSLVVLYSRANSDTILQNSFGFVSCILCNGIPSHRMNLRKRFMIRLCTMFKTIILSAQSARKSDILRHKEEAIYFKGIYIIF